MSDRLGRVTATVGNADAIVFILSSGFSAAFTPDFASAGIAQAGPDMIYLFSRIPSGFHDSTVTLEAWSGPPPAAAGWEEHCRLSLSVSGEQVFVSAGLERPVGDALALKCTGDYTVEVYAKGRREVQELAQRRDFDPEDLPSGIERFLVQFWPQDHS
ncbi:MAG TPA: hypothetical protein VNV66_18585 [Pilimelia sp.]|nr:hypothetical protein [Pilimelia sp.]